MVPRASVAAPALPDARGPPTDRPVADAHM